MNRGAFYPRSTAAAPGSPNVKGARRLHLLRTTAQSVPPPGARDRGRRRDSRLSGEGVWGFAADGAWGSSAPAHPVRRGATREVDVTTIEHGGGSRPAAAGESDLRRAFLAELELIPEGRLLARCQQCGTCTGSCPVSYAMDISPREMVARFRAGNLTELVGSRSIWLCSSCYACTTRCPVGIKLTDIVYTLKRLAVARRRVPSRLPVLALPAAFIESVRWLGRNSEAWFMLAYYRRTGFLQAFGKLGVALALLRRGRLPLRPSPMKGRREVRDILRRAAAMPAAGA